MMFTSANMPAIGSRVVLHMGDDRDSACPCRPMAASAP